MATLTKAAYIKANENLHNGFKFDATFYCAWNEKRVTKVIQLENGDYLKVAIEYLDKIRTGIYSGDYETLLTIHFSQWHPLPSGCATSRGCGKSVTISGGHTRKMYNKIQAETINWPDEKCLQLFNDIVKADPENWSVYA